MISKKMSDMAKNGSAIRAMFEEGKKMAALYGKENVYDFSLGNPNTPPPESVREAAIAILQEESPIFLHGYMSNTGYEDVRDTIAASLNEKTGLTPRSPGFQPGYRLATVRGDSPQTIAAVMIAIL